MVPITQPLSRAMVGCGSCHGGHAAAGLYLRMLCRSLLRNLRLPSCQSVVQRSGHGYGFQELQAPVGRPDTPAVCFSSCIAESVASGSRAAQDAAAGWFCDCQGSILAATGLGHQAWASTAGCACVCVAVQAVQVIALQLIATPYAVDISEPLTFSLGAVSGLSTGTMYTYAVLRGNGMGYSACENLGVADFFGTLAAQSLSSLTVSYSTYGVFTASLSAYAAYTCPAGSMPGMTQQAVAQGNATIWASAIMATHPCHSLRKAVAWSCILHAQYCHGAAAAQAQYSAC